MCWIAQAFGMNARQLVGRNIRRLRVARRLTQEVVSDRAALSQQHFSEVERGQANATIDTLAAIAAALSIRMVELFEDEHPAS
ncbi:helix-turn-helix domain-containing protein [Boseaceae bacterium BT-24-1]|nr:helix-turn-helix domain-containing protein [Boseaceae bacterium BT-24-1]